jgi:uncharacterized protein YndB with AHSA1/START domain
VAGVDCDAPAEAVWALIARPDQWHRWSPHVSGAEGLGEPEVELGAKGHVVLRGGVRIPAEVTEVSPGRSWTWKVGGIIVHHKVTPRGGDGCRLEMPVESDGRPWGIAAALYSPFVEAIARRIARIAEQGGEPEVSSP